MRAFGLNDFMFILLALRWTLGLTIVAFVGGALSGMVVALLGLSDNRTVRLLTRLYTQVIQGLPVLVLLFLCYFGLSVVGVEVNALFSAAIALTVHSSAFLGVIWESSLRAVPVVQWESASSLALTRFQTLSYIIVPQAVRLAVPPTVGFFVQVIKQTSLASIIGFVEVTRAGQLVSNATFEPLKAFGSVAAFYFLLCFPLSLLSRRLEKRYSPVEGA